MRFALVALSVACAAAQCTTDLDCSLNGVCASAQCTCDAPWSGPSCAKLTYATTPAIGKNIYDGNDPHNTWNGPIEGPDAEGIYHAYIPLYKPDSLWHVITLMHGVSDNVVGPWDWASRPNLTSSAINPGFLTYPNTTTGEPVYSIWAGGSIVSSDSLDGPFLHDSKYGGLINPAPIYFKGTFYLAQQSTRSILSSPAVGGPWTLFSNITHSPAQGYVVEDPFMWIDSRSNWHIINHAYNLSQSGNCGDSDVSSHFFSTDGIDWLWSDAPYGHTVQYDDGTSHTYATMERPRLVFNAKGQPAFLNVAADIVAQDACPNAGTCCACCKYTDHAGSIVIALAV